MTFVMSETAKDYEKAVGSIKNRGYTICGLIIDGKQREVRTHALTTGNCAIKLPMKFFFYICNCVALDTGMCEK